MKKLMSGILLAGVMTSASALSPKLNTTMDLFKECMAEVKVPLCDANFDQIVSELKEVNLDARGEFVYVLKDVLKKESSKEVVVNLYEKLQVLAPIYVEIDGTSVWSGRDILGLLGEVSVEYIKYVTVDAKTLEDLFVQQATPAARYKFVVALHSKVATVSTQQDVEELIAFGEFAKDFIKSKGDEYYIYQTAVDLVKKLTVKNLEYVVGFEGVYEVKLLDASAGKTLKIDNLVISSSDEKNGLLVNFVSSELRVTKFSFKGAGLLGSTAFSNEKVYVNSNELVSPGFKFDIDFDSNTVRGSFYSKRFGAVEFVGKQKSSNAALYEEAALEVVSLEEVMGVYPVNVGNYAMTLKIEKTQEGTELALINNNALIVFSKVSYNPKFGVIKALDWQLSKVLEVKVSKVNGEVQIVGQFTNSAAAKVLNVKN